MYDPTDPFRFLPQLPVRSDEAILELSGLLYNLSRQFDECYREQIVRAHNARRSQRQRLAEKPRRYDMPQSKLPEEIYRPFSARRRRS